MYQTRPGLLIGFHGCDKHVQQKLLNDSTVIPMSAEPYDWLGNGMYFWENNYERAKQWAEQKKDRGSISEPAVIGAVIDLGNCCDFLDSTFTQMLGTYYRFMKIEYNAIKKPLPVNKDAAGDPNKDRLVRFLDCAAIQYMHSKMREQADAEIKTQGYSFIKQFDSVRGVFPEGGPAFDGAGIELKSHIQICIRNTNCIKGFFLKREEIIPFNDVLTKGL
jgi:hypothetical protein